MGSANKRRRTREKPKDRAIREPWAKRPFDMLLALIGLILSFPLWAIIPLAIYLEVRGPVFFSQERVGKEGKLFTALKFRTMRIDAHQGGVVDIENDPRVTRVGRLLRAMALDEIPQLLNILRGNMSFVGPRPLPFIVESQEKDRYPTLAHVPGYDLRIKARPGLTGIAVIYASKDISHRQRFRYDALYIRNMSFWLDVKLILLSFWVSFRGAWERRGRKVHR